MKLWMSGEIQHDIAEGYRQARLVVQSKVNERLQRITLNTNLDQWAFIGIIRPDDHPDYQEVKKFDKRHRTIEFRLKIDHAQFLSGSHAERVVLIIQALRRSVDLMNALGVDSDDIDKLKSILMDA